MDSALVGYSSKLSKINDEINQLNIEIAGNRTALDSMKELADVSQDDLYNQKEKLNKEINNNVQKKAELEKKLADAEIDYSKISERLNAAQENLVEFNDKLNETSEKLGNSLKKNAFESIESVKEVALDEESLENLKKEVNEYNISVSNSKSLLDTYIEKGYDKLQKIDLDNLKQKLDEANKVYNSTNDLKISLNAMYDHNENNLDELKSLSNNEKTLSNEYNELYELYNVASGQVSGNKMNFEVYYQMQVFDNILKVASAKFSRMTDNRYRLVHGIPKGQGQIGLDIDVIDVYNGGQRPVSSLSGGESFQASMALALSFAEIIRRDSGGVELKSMFIDEGFGTLDKEMLNNTKKMLLEIGEETNRRIAIISHIDELKNSIPSQIIVTKSDQGSSFKIVNN